MILVIDNYDSFVHNLARYVQRTGEETRVVRNDQITLEEIEVLGPQAIILSPGPCTPKEAGLSINIVKRFAPAIPILGVCLGHQIIGEAFGGQTARTAPMHGQASQITHNNDPLFKDLPSPMTVGRYHSLITQLNEGSALETIATYNDIIMAMKHRTYPCYGVQFHPESILTPQGMALIHNFTHITKIWHAQKDKAA